MHPVMQESQAVVYSHMFVKIHNYNVIDSSFKKGFVASPVLFTILLCLLTKVWYGKADRDQSPLRLGADVAICSVSHLREKNGASLQW